jgi:microsomal dipeptidase-like Zn-dependent dipeptidase
VIGINLFRPFIGEDFEKNLLKIVEHAHRLKGEKNLCFGADFFFDSDFSTSLKYPQPFFEPGFDNSSCYPRILQAIISNFSKETAEDIAHKNFMRFAGSAL